MKADDQPPHDGDEPGAPARGALDWPLAAGRVTDFLAAIAVRKRRRRQRRIQAVIALVGAIGIYGVASRVNLAPEQRMPTARIVVSTTSAHLSVPARRVLEDGSVVELKDDAELALAFTDGVRRVILRRGEAHFAVAKNPNRPFVVEAGGIEVRAVGTAFAVRHRARAIEVVVTEGRVAVEESGVGSLGAVEPAVASRANASASDAANRITASTRSASEATSPVAISAEAGARTLAMLDAGTGAVVEIASAAVRGPRGSNARVFAVSTLEMDQRLAWRAPRLELSSTTLSQAISLINRYSATRLVLGDDELGTLELSGVLRVDNVEPLLRVLEQNYRIKAERSGDEIVLRKSQ